MDVSQGLPAFATQNFNGVMFMTDDQIFAERVRAYGSEGDALTDGFSSTSDTYLALSTGFAQKPRPSQILVGRRDASVATLTLAEAKVVNSTKYIVTVQGTAFTFTSASDAEDDKPAAVELILDGLQVLIDADAAVKVEVVATSTGTSAATALVLTEQATYDMTASFDKAVFTVTYTQEDWATAITGIRAENANYWALASYDHTQEGILAIAAAHASYVGDYFASQSVANNKDAENTDDADDTLQKLTDLNYGRTVFAYSDTSDETFLEMGWICDKITYAAGSTNWNLSAVQGVASDNLSPTEITNIDAKNGNYFIEYGGIDMVSSGKAVNGDWIDVTHGGDNLKSDMQVELIRIKATANNGGGKIAMTDEDMEIMRAGADSVLQRYATPARNFLKTSSIVKDAFGNQSIKPGWVIRQLTVDEIGANQRAARIMPAMSIEADLSGAANTGTVTINLYV